MKKFKTIILICLFASFCNAQNLFEEGLELNYYLTHFSSSTAFSNINVNKVRVLNDTVILDQTCSILKFDISTCDLRPTENYIKYSADSIMYYNENLDEFKLLYDFTLKQGDTLKLDYWEPDFVNDSIFYVKVLSVDSIMINNNLSKRMLVTYDNGYGDEIDFENSYMDAYWIQGIGSTVNFFHFSGLGLCDLRYNQCLKSFEHPSLGLHEFEGCITSIDFNFEKNINKVYPNPFTDVIKISLTNNISRIQILNANGETVYNNTVNNNPTDLVIENKLLPGLYLIVFYNELNQNIQTEKVIKMNSR